MNTSCFPKQSDIPEQYRLRSAVDQVEYLVNGQIIKWSGQTTDVYSPVCVESSGGSLKQVRVGCHPVLGHNEAMKALDAARKAFDNGFGRWPMMTVRERGRCVRAFIEAMKASRDEIVKLIMWEIAKPLADAEKEFDRTVIYIENTIDALEEMSRSLSRIMEEEGVAGQVKRVPLGVVLCMGPYNYPLNETLTLLFPALLMGNTLIIKPPKHGVLLFRPMLDALAGCFPKGVVNIIYGDGETLVTPLMRSGGINVLAFIGSGAVANSIRSLHPKPNRLRCCLGLEAKNAGIIIDGADIEKTVDECLKGSLSFNGQRCTALKMLFVHKSCVDEFSNMLAVKMSLLKCGMPWEKDVQITPMPDFEKISYLEGLIDDARSHGSVVLNPDGGQSVGTMMKPGLLYPVSDSSRIFRAEQFGPVVPLAVFDNIDIPVKYIATSDYGQQVSLFGGDHGMLGYLITSLAHQVSRINLNTQCQRGPDSFPFTGRKDSAEGTLSTIDALRAFSIRSLVATKSASENVNIMRIMEMH
jgi:glyceraldehyde-3-phosphate dehydrogenase (NADP+)